MASLSSVFFLLAVFAVGVLSSYDGLQVKDLSQDLQKQLQYIMENFFLDDITTDCTIPTKPEVKYLLYTRSTPDLPQIVDPTDPYQIHPKTKFLMVVPGWLASPSSEKILHLKNEYLKRYDCNVVVVDWSTAASKLYNVTFCDMPMVGQSVADFICTLADKRNLHPTLIHAMGHSLGAQVLGLAAEHIRSRCAMQVGRITGLDVAGIIFEKLPLSQQLDKSDAEFVDMIHTDGSAGFGIWLNKGHVGFHPNCAKGKQPGCPIINKVFPETSLSDIFCNSDRSVEYMAESINNNNLIAVSCGICPRLCESDIISEVYAYMGEECRQIPKPAKSLFLVTNDKPPYGRGWDPYPMSINKTVCVNAISSP